MKQCNPIFGCPRIAQQINLVPAYVRHKPEQTLLYPLVEQYWPGC